MLQRWAVATLKQSRLLQRWAVATLKRSRLLQRWAVATVVGKEEGLAEWHSRIKCQNINYMRFKTTHVTVTVTGVGQTRKNSLVTLSTLSDIMESTNYFYYCFTVYISVFMNC